MRDIPHVAEIPKSQGSDRNPLSMDEDVRISRSQNVRKFMFEYLPLIFRRGLMDPLWFLVD